MINKESDIDALISLGEASRLSGLSSAHIRRLVGDKIVWGKKIGRNWITSKQAIIDYIKEEHRPGRKANKP